MSLGKLRRSSSLGLPTTRSMSSSCLLRSDSQQDIAEQNDILGLCHPHAAVPHQARHDDLGSVQDGDLADGAAGKVVVEDLDVHGGDLGDALGLLAAEVGALLAGVDAEDRADQQHGQDDADHAEGVGDGIGLARQGYGGVQFLLDLGSQRDGGLGGHQFAQGLLGGGEARRVGRAAAKEAYRRFHADVPGLADDDGKDGAEEDDCCGHEVQPQPMPPQRREEAGPHLQADRVDEQDQSELAGELQDLRVDLQADLAGEDPGKQDPGDAQADAQHADRA